jgi:uncharacterized membrane protein YdjX (TVP38/TMEM64 family)
MVDDKADEHLDRLAPQARRGWGRWLVAALLVGAVAAFFALGGQRYLTWESLLAHRDQLKAEVDAHWWLALLIYFLIYVAVTGLSLPGAAVMSLAGGAMFGRWWGTAVTSFASTAGATGAFLLSRYLLRDFVQRRWGGRLEAINRGLERDGPYYLLFLRLVPAFPFVLINLAMGLTRMRVWTYWWVSQFGMLPGTFLYLNAGTELGRLNSPRDVLSPGLLVAFTLLAVFPLLVRQAVRWWQRRRARPGGA